ncbi:MAG: hypothetical protein R3F61_04285 [Myxococcota bacterium]
MEKSPRPKARPTAAPETSLRPQPRPADLDVGMESSLRPKARPEGMESSLRPKARPDSYLESAEETILLRSSETDYAAEAAAIAAEVAGGESETILLRSSETDYAAEAKAIADEVTRAQLKPRRMFPE